MEVYDKIGQRIEVGSMIAYGKRSGDSGDLELYVVDSIVEGAERGDAKLRVKAASYDMKPIPGDENKPYGDRTYHYVYRVRSVGLHYPSRALVITGEKATEHPRIKFLLENEVGYTMTRPTDERIEELH